MLDYEDESYYLDTKQIIDKLIEHSLSNWFDKAKKAKKFRPDAFYLKEVPYFRQNTTITFSEKPILTHWFNVAKKLDYFKPDIERDFYE